MATPAIRPQGIAIAVRLPPVPASTSNSQATLQATTKTTATVAAPSTAVSAKPSRKRPLAATAANGVTKQGTGDMRPPTKKLVMSDLPLRMLDPKIVKECIKPHDFLLSHLQSLGVSVSVYAFSSLPAFFSEFKQEEIEAYGFEALDAVRSKNFDKLRELHAQGKPLKCSNRFGESLLHLACRKGFADVTKFLVEEAQVPVEVKDDFGRNPAHDACWTCEPDFDLMDVLLDRCPDLLFISDARGHTPLTYARRQHWDAWVEYIRRKGTALSPKNLPQVSESKQA